MTARASAGETLLARALFETRAWARAAVTGSCRPSCDSGIIASDRARLATTAVISAYSAMPGASTGTGSRSTVEREPRGAQYAPRPPSTAGIVRAMIETSSQIDHASM